MSIILGHSMLFSRFQIASLGLFSIFTGIIVPIALIDGNYLPLPLTNFFPLAIFLLLLIILGFFSIIFGRWKLYESVILLTTLCIIFLAWTIPLGMIRTLHGNGEVITYSWSWIFFIGGILFFFLSQFFHDARFSRYGKAIYLNLILLFLVGMSGVAYFSLFYSNNTTSSMLESIFPVSTETIAGLRLSPPTGGIRDMALDVGNQKLAYSYLSGSDTYVFLGGKGSGETLSFSGINSTRITYFGGQPYTLISGIDMGSRVYSGSEQIMGGPTIVPIEDENGKILSWMSFVGDGWIWKNVLGNSQYIAHTGTDTPIVKTRNGKILLVASRHGALWNIERNGEILLSDIGQVLDMTPAQNGYDSIALMKDAGSTYILQNGTQKFPVERSFIEESFRTNGEDVLYETKKNNYIQMHWNSVTLSGLYETIGPAFVLPRGSGYAFFGQKIYETDEWCLFLPGKELCGLQGFMNPVISEDGKSILYAGLRDDIWSVYENDTVVVRSTNYISRANGRDFFFVNREKPEEFVFFVYDPLSDTYMINHNATLLPQAWRGIYPAVWFGYDGTLATAVRYDTVWHIAEIFAPPF